MQLRLVCNSGELRLIFTDGKETLLWTIGVVGTAEQDGEEVGSTLVLRKDIPKEGTSLLVTTTEGLHSIHKDIRSLIKGETEDAVDVVVEDSTKIGSVRSIEECCTRTIRQRR